MPRNLALNISVGALLDNSVGKTFKRATTSLQQLGDEHKELNAQFKKVQSVNRYAERLGKLRAQAEASGKVSDSLARRLRNAEARFNAAATDAKAMGHELRDLGRVEQQLKQKIERTNAAIERRERLGQRLTGLRTGLASAGRGLATTGVWAGGSIGAGLAAVTLTNRMSAQQANLAAAVGLSAKEMGIWSAIVEQAGFDAEHVNSLVEELNNKFGESKGLGEQTTAVKDAMTILRLDFERLKRLKPDQQFRAIVEAAQQIGGQEAVSAADILLGGEASRIIGYLNSLNLPVAEVFRQFERLYIGSQEGLEGAKAFGVAWSELAYTLGQALKEVSGLIGTELAPQMRLWAEQLAKSFRKNRDDIETFIEGMGATLKQLGKGLASLAENLPTIVEAMTTLSDLVVKWFGGGRERQRQERLAAHQEEQAKRRALVKEQQKEDPKLNKPYAAFNRSQVQELLKNRTETLQLEPVVQLDPALDVQPTVEVKPVLPDWPKALQQEPPSPQPLADIQALQALVRSRQTPAPVNRIQQDNRMNNTFYITQQAGESTEQLARRIAGRLPQEQGSASESEKIFYDLSTATGGVP